MSAVRGGSPASPSKHLTVVDVYDLAASIGNDFERIIEQFGSEVVRSLMPKVISALETLESLAGHNERENEEIVDLQKTVERLQSEQHSKKQERIKFEMELEQVEENYRREIAELKQLVRSLQAENRQLSQSLPVDATTPVSSTNMRDEDLLAIVELREESSKQKEQIRELQRDIDRYACEIDNLQNSVEKLIRQNEELLRKNTAMRAQGRALVEEKTALNSRLMRAEEASISLRKALNETSRTCRDQQEMLKDEKGETSPRFTLSELRGVLREKTELKSRVIELEEELDRLRPRPPSPAAEALSDESVQSDGDRGELLYGPINREPDEKLFPWKYHRKDSGVRKFFRFFKDGISSSSSPRRGSGTSPLPSLRTATHRESPRPGDGK